MSSLNYVLPLKVPILLPAIWVDGAEKQTIDGKRDRLGAAGHATELVRLLALRNAQLAKFITRIATLCHHTENDDVTNSSTSLQWIFDYLKKHYDTMDSKLKVLIS